MNTIRNLNKHMKGSRGLYFASLLSIALASFFGLLQPQIIRIILDVGLGNGEWTGAAWVGKILQNLGGAPWIQTHLPLAAALSVAMMALSGLFLYLRGRWAAIAAEDTARRLRERLYNHLHLLEFDYFSRANTGDLIQRCTSDLETVRSFLATQAVEIGRGVFLVLLTGLLMFRSNALLAVVSLSILPAIVVFGYIFFQKVRKTFQESDAAEGQLSDTLQENVSGIRVVRAFARRDYEEQRFDKRNVDFRDKTYKLIRLLAWYWSISNLLCTIQIGLVTVVGGIMAAQGTITIGTAVVFFSYVARLLWPVRQMGRILSELGKTSVSLGRMEEILAEPPETEEGTHQQPIQGSIEFDQVSFGYRPDQPVLKNVSFRAKPGEVVAILGPTGAGKSTLAHLIPRLYDPQAGRILIDGVDSRQWNKRKLREQICIILQEPFLFHRSVKENVALAVQDAGDDEVCRSTRLSALHDVIEGFEKGYDTMVGEGGVTLSGGQKQRVALARTLMRQPRVVILDDSLSAVDAETDERIRGNLKEAFGDSTVFIIAHRAGTLMNADRILVLEDGQVTQEGQHEDLVATDGLYQRIWNLQKDGELAS